MLNGVSGEAEIYSDDHIKHIHNCVIVEIEDVRNDNEISFNTLGRIVFGDISGTLPEDVIDVENVYNWGGITNTILVNILHTIWWKSVINVGINHTSVGLKVTYEVF